MADIDTAVENSDREIWRERDGDFCADAIRVTQGGGIGIDCGGHVIVLPVREWHRLAAEPGWRTIESHPKDGTHFLARQKIVAVEEDEDGNVIKRGVVEYFTVVAYSLSKLGFASESIVQFPWNGGIPSNVTYTHWMPLPEPPETGNG